MSERKVVDPPVFDPSAQWAFRELSAMQDQINELQALVDSLQEQLAKSAE